MILHSGWSVEPHLLWSVHDKAGRMIAVKPSGANRTPHTHAKLVLCATLSQHQTLWPRPRIPPAHRHREADTERQTQTDGQRDRETDQTDTDQTATDQKDTDQTDTDQRERERERETRAHTHTHTRARPPPNL